MPFIEVAGQRLFYTDVGIGEPPLLLVHGFTCDSHDWSWQIPDFALGHRVISVDLRGHGRSGVPDRGYDPENYINDLAGLIETMAGGPVLAIGHSMGGALISMLAVERPDLVRALVAIDPAYLIPPEWVESVRASLEELNSDDPIAAVQSSLAASYGPGSSTALRTWHARRVAGMAPQVLRDTLNSLMTGFSLRAECADYLRRRRVPVLAMYAHPNRAITEADVLTDDASRVVTFEGAGHWLHQERAAEVNHIIETWIASVLRREPQHDRTS